MESQEINFSNIIDTLYNLSLEDKMEIKTLLENNIADARRNEIAINYKKAQKENKSGKLSFSSNLDELKKML